MNVTVFGATGAIGALTVAELLAAGHTVTAYARNSRKIPDGWGDRVRVVIGEMNDYTAISGAIHGADAVISALGPSMDRKAVGTPLVEGTQHIVAAMREHGVTRFVGHATPSILDPKETGTFATRLITLMPKTFMPRAYEEVAGMSQIVMRSELDWTIIRFIAPTNAARRGRIRVGFFGTDKLGVAISRADIAAFTAAQLSDATYIRRAPAITN